jgi:7-cyano-7-deazaguanine synthase
MSPKENAIALLSGGLDSTVSLAEGTQQYNVVLALTFNYGQRAFGKEIRASRMIADYYKVKHEVIALPWLSALLPKALQPRKEGREPMVPPEWLAGPGNSDAYFEAKPVWVPNRNGLFLNIAATYAEANDAKVILFGANAEEGERFPDNTEEFRTRMNAAFELSTLNQPQVVCPVGLLNKPQIIDRAKALNVPLQMIWSCYTDADQQCGDCPSCYRLKRALETSPSGAVYREKLAFIH